MERLWKGCEQNELQKQFRRGVFRRNLWGAKCAKGKGKAMQGYARLARLAFVGEMKAWRSRWKKIWKDGKHMQTACSVEGKPSKYPDMSRYVTTDMSACNSKTLFQRINTLLKCPQNIEKWSSQQIASWTYSARTFGVPLIWSCSWTVVEYGKYSRSKAPMGFMCLQGGV